MGWLDRVANAFRRRQLDDEIDEELRFHVESRAAGLERQDRSPDEARREAQRLLGNAVALRDRTRESDVWVMLETAVQDVRYALPCSDVPRSSRSRHRSRWRWASASTPPCSASSTAS